MKIFIGADHRGFQLKAGVMNHLRKLGHEVIDKGAFQTEVPSDYPLIAKDVAEAVASTPGSRGVLVCLSGTGIAIAANKVPGAYAALCYNKEAAMLARSHNNSNILVLGAKFVPAQEFIQIIETWLSTDFEGGRHERRIQQIKDIEKKYSRTT